MPADEALKRLRITRKKVRQIDELLQARHDGVELNAEQEHKILLRPKLAKELVLRTKQVEEQRKAEAAGEKHAPLPEEEEEEEEEEEDEQPAPAKDNLWAADAEKWGGGSAEAWHVAGQTPKKAAPKKKTSKTPATMPPQKAQAPEADAGDDWNSDIPPSASVAERTELQEEEVDALIAAPIAAPIAEGSTQEVVVEEEEEEVAPAPAPPAPTPVREDKRQEPAKQPPKPAPKKDQEQPYRKGWRGGSFVSRRIPSAHRTAVACVFVARGAGGPGRIVTGGYDNIAKVWSLETLREEQSLGGHTKAVTACFADSIYLATASDDGTVKYWTGGHCDTSLYTFSPVKCMTIDGDDLITGHADGTVRVYEAGVGGTEPPRLTLKGHTGEVTSVRTANGGASIISTAKDSSCRIWDLVRGTQLHMLCDEEDLDSGTHTYAAAWLRDEKVVITTHDDGTCRQWAYPFTTASLSLLPDQGMTDCEPLLFVDPLGSTMALSRHDGSFAGCDPKSMQYLYTLSSVGGGGASCLHCSGDVAVVGTFDGHVTLLEGVDERKVAKGTELVPCGPPLIGGKASPSKSSDSKSQSKKKKGAGGGGADGIEAVRVDKAGRDAARAIYLQAAFAAAVAAAIFVVWQFVAGN